MLLPTRGAVARRTPARGVATVVATLTDPSDATARQLRQLPAAVTVLEVRADLVGDLDPASVRRYFSGRLVYTLRSAEAGGRASDRTLTRHARLLSATSGYDVVDLEWDRDLVPEVLGKIPAHRRRISYLGGPMGLTELGERFQEITRTPAGLYLLAAEATSFDQAVVPLQLLAQLDRTDVTAYATGPAGGWTRVLSPWLGAPIVSGPVRAVDTAAPTVHQLLSDYPFPQLPPLSTLYGLVAPATNTTLFVRLLNAAFRTLGLPGLYLPFAVPDEDAFQRHFWPVVDGGTLNRLGLPLKGLTLAAPYKELALTLADSATPRAWVAGAANLLFRRDNAWRAGMTDGTAVRAALRTAGFSAARRRVAVVGCGGAGRAAAAALRAAGSEVTLVNRSANRGRAAADLLGLPLVPLPEFDPGGYAAVVHATPARDEVAFDAHRLRPSTAVADFVCAATSTALVRAARSGGLRVVDGRDVLRQEAARHFEAMTGHRLPRVRDVR
jgi:3-dehydroquinate dehydratase/shikimate dehydrogenase